MDGENIGNARELQGEAWRQIPLIVRGKWAFPGVSGFFFTAFLVHIMMDSSSKEKRIWVWRIGRTFWALFDTPQAQRKRFFYDRHGFNELVFLAQHFSLSRFHADSN